MGIKLDINNSYKESEDGIANFIGTYINSSDKCSSFGGIKIKQDNDKQINKKKS